MSDLRLGSIGGYKPLTGSVTRQAPSFGASTNLMQHLEVKDTLRKINLSGIKRFWQENIKHPRELAVVFTIISAIAAGSFSFLKTFNAGIESLSFSHRDVSNFNPIVEVYKRAKICLYPKGLDTVPKTLAAVHETADALKHQNYGRAVRGLSTAVGEFSEADITAKDGSAKSRLENTVWVLKPLTMNSDIDFELLTPEQINELSGENRPYEGESSDPAVNYEKYKERVQETIIRNNYDYQKERLSKISR